ncbi:MAG: diguanylate cyclase [Desulfobacterales bacterium]|nr:diguanylate cyclase [Desulfobacterales bacterium]
MKIAFPVQTEDGLGSQVYNHFGSASTFFVVDSETGEGESVGNADLNHIHGQCQPLAALNGAIVDAIVVGGIGRGALHKLQKAGIKSFKAVEGSVAENLELFKSGKLPEFPVNHNCAGHGADGGCAH